MKTPPQNHSQQFDFFFPPLEIFEESISNQRKSADKYRYQKIESQIQSQRREAIHCFAPETIALISPPLRQFQIISDSFKWYDDQWNKLNGGLASGGSGTYQDGHSVLVSDIVDIPILNNLIADFSTDLILGIADFKIQFAIFCDDPIVIRGKRFVSSVEMKTVIQLSDIMDTPMLNNAIHVTQLYYLIQFGEQGRQYIFVDFRIINRFLQTFSSF